MRAELTSEIKAEPNLVPLLDLVFQLIMFFMVCVNFVSQQVNEDIKLPVAQSARPMDKTEVDVLFLNVDQSGKLIVPGREQALATLPQMRVYLRQVNPDANRAAEEKGGKNGRAKPEDARPDQSMAGELQLPAEVTVVAKTRRPDGSQDGSITQISVQEQLGTKDLIKLDPGAKDIANLDALRKYLQTIRGGLTNQN